MQLASVAPLTFSECYETKYPNVTNSIADTSSDSIGYGYGGLIYPYRALWGGVPQFYRRLPNMANVPTYLFNSGQEPYYSSDMTYMSPLDPPALALKYNSCGSVSYNYEKPEQPKFYGTSQCLQGTVIQNNCAPGYVPVCNGVDGEKSACARMTDVGCDYGWGFNAGQWKPHLIA